MQAWPGCLFFILNPACCSLKHLGNNSVKASKEKRKAGCLAGLHWPRVLLSHLRLVDDLRLVPQEMVPGVVWIFWIYYLIFEKETHNLSAPWLKCMFIFSAFVFQRSALGCGAAIVRMEKNRTILMCCLHFLTVKKQPVISCNTVVTSVVTLLLGFQLMKYFPPGYNYLSLLFFLLFSPFIFHPHANNWLNGHPCFWSFQEWATKVLTHILLDPVSKLWTPRSHFLTTSPEWAEELSLLYWVGIGGMEEKAMAAHSSSLAWKIPWMEEPGGLQSMGSQRVGHDWATSLSLFTFMHWRRKRQPTPVFLPGESQGWAAGWTADYGVAQSQTRLRRLSSSRGTECRTE